MPRLQSIFASEGAPPELAWIAEAESGLNPHIQGNYGGRGYFQLTRQTARSLGLRTFWPDDRLDPERSARAAARRLRALRDRFGSWPLALAAYNAGEGRVARAIAAAHSRSFGPVAAALPPTTRGYVPRVLALVERRTGVSLDEAADSK
jgi:membrane-bound lytic murein transglycosylase D